MAGTYYMKYLTFRRNILWLTEEAKAAGGLKMLKAMAAPYGQLTFMPTGGINADNLLDYLKFGKIVACGGSFMVKDDLIREKKWDEITALTKNAVKTMLGLEFLHMGINNENADEAAKAAKLFEMMFGLALKDGSKSIFAGKEFEVMKFMGVCKCGHIGLSVTSVKRAVRFFKSQGFEFNYDTVTTDDKGNMNFIYFKDEIGGFGVHLVNA